MAHGKPGFGRCDPIQERTSEGFRYRLSLTNIIEKRRSLRSTHTLQSDAGHAPSQDTRQPQFLRIGQWPSRITPDIASTSIALGPHSSIVRTGTDLQNEETSIGTARSRIRSDDQILSECQHEHGDVSMPHSASSSEHSAIFKNQNQGSLHDYYQFEWFRILVGMVLLMVSEVILFGLITLGNIVSLWLEILASIAIGLLSLLLYAGFFVVLTEYHEAVGNFLNRYARLRPGLQHACLRLCAYIYALGVIAAIALWLSGVLAPA